MLTKTKFWRNSLIQMIPKRLKNKNKKLLNPLACQKIVCMCAVRPGVDFIKQFTTYAWNLWSAPILFEKFALIWNHAFAPWAQLFALSPRFWVRSMLYPMRPTFMKPTSGLLLCLIFWIKAILPTASLKETFGLKMVNQLSKSSEQ